MKRIFIFLFCLITCLFIPFKSEARKSIAISGFGGGEFPLLSSYPDLDIGAGGGVSFEYRFNQHWGISTSLSVFAHNGEGVSAGDKDMLFLDVPDVDLKFYFLSQERAFDPYISAGMGIGVLTEGSIDNNSGGAGIGSQVGLGSDFYLKDWLSVGLLAQFKTLALIRGSSQSSALLFMRALGNFTFHFK